MNLNAQQVLLNRFPLRRWKCLSVLVLCAVMLIAFVPVRAEGEGSSSGKPSAAEEHHSSKKSGAGLLEGLNLTEEQRKTLQTIQKEAHEQSQSLKAKLQEKRKALMEYINHPEATESRALAIQNELSQLQDRLGELRMKTWFKMRGILTPEQLSQWEQKRKERLSRLKEQIEKRRSEFQKGGDSKHRPRPHPGTSGEHFDADPGGDASFGNKPFIPQGSPGMNEGP